MPDFYENSVNKILRDIVAAVNPNGASSAANSLPAGLTTSIFAGWPEINMKSKRESK